MRTMQLQAVDSQGFAHGKVGTFKELGAKKVLYEDEDGISRHTRIRLVVPREFKEWEVMSAIDGEYAYSNCAHAHDCCGCRFAFVTMIRRTRKRREYVINLVEGRNI